MHSLLSICMNKKSYFTKMVLLSSLNARTDHDVRSNKLRVDDAKPNTKQRHLNGILCKMWFCCKIENFAKSAQIWSQRVPHVLTKKTSTHNYNVSDHKQRSY